MEKKRSAEPGEALLVQRQRVDDQRDQRPDFFGIPSPVASP